MDADSRHPAIDNVLKRNGWPRNTGRFRKKPVAIYASEFKPKARYWPPSIFETGHAYYVRTAHGDVKLNPGDYVCWQKVNGKIDVWPVDREIFMATYEKAL